MLLLQDGSPAKLVWEACPPGWDPVQTAGAQRFPILAWQGDKSSSMNNGFFATSRWEDAVGLAALSANRIILYSHLKPLVHSFCSPRITQFALLWLAMCWSSVLHSSPSSKARLDMHYKDRKTGEKHLGFLIHVAELMLWERGAECNYWPLTLPFISATPVAESAWEE